MDEVKGVGIVLVIDVFQTAATVIAINNNLEFVKC